MDYKECLGGIDKCCKPLHKYKEPLALYWTPTKRRTVIVNTGLRSCKGWRILSAEHVEEERDFRDSDT